MSQENGHRQVDQAHILQGTVEGVGQPAETVAFMGERFRVAERVGLWPLLQFSHAASQGMDSESLDGMAAMYALIRDCIDQGTPACGKCEKCKPLDGAQGRPDLCPHYDRGDFARFERVAIESKADHEDLLALVSEVMEMITARPTTPPSGSSSPERRKSGRSKGRSSSPGRVPPEAAELVPVSAVLR